MDLNAQKNAGGIDDSKPGDLQGAAASIVHDVLEGAPAASPDKVKPVVGKMPNATQAPLYQAVHAAADAAASMPPTSASLGDSITRYVRAKPRQSVGIAFVAGFLIARLVL